MLKMCILIMGQSERQMTNMCVYSCPVNDILNTFYSGKVRTILYHLHLQNLIVDCLMVRQQGARTEAKCELKGVLVEITMLWYHLHLDRRGHKHLQLCQI